jgi:RNA polymerase sigma-70 factor (ECF subfamily)
VQSDEELVRRILASPEGDTRAFEQLVRRHQASILANCRHLTRASDDAEDLAQEVFVKVFFKLEQFAGRARFRTWLQRIKVHHCFNYLTRRKGRGFLDVDDPALEHEAALSVPSQAEDRAAAAEERARIREVLDALPDSLRIPLVLCDVDGLSYQEVADALGIGLSATKMRISRARAAFRRLYALTLDTAASPRAAAR